MPRAHGYSTSHVSTVDYFDSLQSLQSYISSPRRVDRHEPKPVPLIQLEGDSPRSKLLVCHDYKGGYCEKDDERGYTFVWWHLIDTFIYFSHHRVSAPPRAWIRAAHMNGVKILGTLIFEWDEGKQDFDRLLGDPSKSDSVSTDVADGLVELALERGFDGWLINIEVPFGIKDVVSVENHIQKMLIWLRYLRDEVARRVPNGEVMWYDGANSSGVRWQNKLSSLNLPFAEQVDSIFLNYFWREKEIRETAATVATTNRSGGEHVYFGLDVYGRGQFGGGGFESFRSLDCVHLRHGFGGESASIVQKMASQPQPSFSVALFAPGWTVESEHLGHCLTEEDKWKVWWTDEQYLWLGTAPGPSVSKEAARMQTVRREERGEARARELAHTLARGQGGPLPPFDYAAPLPELPGRFQPISAYRREARPALAHENVFYTNFCLGAGHHFWLQGQRVMSSKAGWTDIDAAMSFPCLAIPSPSRCYDTELYQDDAWSGMCSLRICAASTSSVIVPICKIAGFEVQSRSTFVATMLWKSEPGNLQAVECNIVVSLAPLSEPPSISTTRLEPGAAQTEEAGNGWRRTTVLIENMDHIGPAQCIYLAAAIQPSDRPLSSAAILVGEVSLAVAQEHLPRPVISNKRWADDGVRLVWNVARRVDSGSPLSPIHVKASQWPAFLFYTVWLVDGNGKEIFLGSTIRTCFDLPRQQLTPGTRIECRGVLVSGVDIHGDDRAVCTI